MSSLSFAMPLKVLERSFRPSLLLATLGCIGSLYATFAFVFGIHLWVSLGLHVVSSWVFSIGFWRLLPKPQQEPRWQAILFSMVLFLMMPGLGCLGLFWVVLPAFHHPKRVVLSPYVSVGIPELPHKPLFTDRNKILRYSEGALAAVLRHAKNPDQRAAAVMAVRQLPDQQAVPILRIALKDPIDDVRLLAYSMLDSKDQEINRRIQQQLAALLQVTDREERFNTLKLLAQNYWELAYLGIAEGDVLSFSLDSSQKHGLMALEIREDVAVRFLLGRVALKQKDYENARREFRLALAFGFPGSTVLPYLAEVAFLERKFDDVRRFMDDIPARFLRRAPLSQVADYWLGGGGSEWH